MQHFSTACVHDHRRIRSGPSDLKREDDRNKCGKHTHHNQARRCEPSEHDKFPLLPHAPILTLRNHISHLVHWIKYYDSTVFGKIRIV